MKDKIEISATIVIFKEDIDTLQKTINCFLNTPLLKKLYLVDNSPTNELKDTFKHPEVGYIFNGKNLGFGCAHNLIIPKLNSDFHLILNPDVIFDSQVLPNLISELKRQENISMISPQLLSNDGTLQYTSRKNSKFFRIDF